MLHVDRRHLHSAQGVRTIKGIYDWLAEVIADTATSRQARNLCTIFVRAIEPQLSLSVIDAQTSSDVWQTFCRLQHELLHGLDFYEQREELLKPLPKTT
ncbi:MAG: hypothetical protein VX601_09220 [Pseudomonadota bacterium]|nr:hypothetical protein [Pseudomonadota bacterium]